MRDHRGSATVMATSLMGLLMTLGVGIGATVALVVDHRAAQSAADLAALGAARALGRGDDPCVVGAQVATANRASLVECEVSGREVRVGVEVEGPRWWGLAADLRAQARAGPSG